MVTKSVRGRTLRLMRGSITKRSDGVWRLRWDGGIDPDTGRRRQQSRTVRGTKKQAEAILNRIVGDPNNPHPEAHTLAELVTAWFDLTEPDLSPTTMERRRGTWRLHVEKKLGNLPIGRIRAEHLDTLYSELRKEGKAATAIKVHSLLSGAFNQAVKWEWVASNPTRRATPPKQKKVRVKVPDVKVVALLLDAADQEFDDGFGILVRLDAMTGMRRGELCALRWRDVDLDNGVIHIRRNIVAVSPTDADRAAAAAKGHKRAKGRLVEKDTKTQMSERDPAIGPKTVAMLRQHKTAMSRRLLELGVRLGGDSYVFPSNIHASRPLHPSVVTHRWLDLRRAHGVGLDLRLHDLRHHSASQLVAAGVDLRTVMERHGWTSLATAQRYVHAVEQKDRDAAVALEGVFG